MKAPQNTPKQVRGPGGRFAKGVSGNPGGRPRGVSLRDVLLRRITEKDAEQIVDAMVVAAKRGDVKAFVALIDRTDGKVPQTVTGGTDDDGNEKPIPLKLI